MRDINRILTSPYRQSVETEFKKHFTPGESDACWEWSGTMNDNGYGLLAVWLGYSYGNEGAHRLSWLFANGQLPDFPNHGRAHILHRCDTPPCVNPAHLFAGTQKDNMQDKSRKGRAPHGETHPNSTLTERIVVAIRASSAPQREIAKQYNIAESVVHMLKRGATWAHVSSPVTASVPGYKRGESHGMATITEEQAKAIKVDPRSGVKVAEAFGVSRYIVSKIRRGKTWKHL